MLATVPILPPSTFPTVSLNAKSDYEHNALASTPRTSTPTAFSLRQTPVHHCDDYRSDFNAKGVQNLTKEISPVRLERTSIDKTTPLGNEATLLNSSERTTLPPRCPVPDSPTLLNGKRKGVGDERSTHKKMKTRKRSTLISSPASLCHTEEACKKMFDAILDATRQGIQTAKNKLKNKEITRTTFAVVASIERTVVTVLGNVIEKIAAVGERVTHVGNETRTKRKKVTDVLISLTDKVYRVEIKTSSNSKTGTDKAQMITNCDNNKETNVEGWWVIAFRKFGENPNMKCFNQDEQRRRLGTKHFWEMCGIDYEKLLAVWHNKDFIIEDMIHESGILSL